MNENLSPRRRGRPVDAAKQDLILTVATDLFLERGFQGASMDLVARLAGVSKNTIYSRFQNKKDLFAAIIDRLAGRLASTIVSFTLEDVAPEQALRRLGKAYLELALAPSSLAIHRTVVAEAARIPDMGRLIFKSGPDQLVDALSDYLRRHDLPMDDPRLAAEEFFGMILGFSEITLLLAARPAEDVLRDIDRRVDHAVRTFLGDWRREETSPDIL
jgi:TetR/AcrR family transcriptional repressor of mexJK operon